MTVHYKTEKPGYYKSSEGFIINKDMKALAAYKKRKARDADVVTLKEDMMTMKEDMSAIKKLLERLVNDDSS